MTPQRKLSTKRVMWVCLLLLVGLVLLPACGSDSDSGNSGSSSNTESEEVDYNTPSPETYPDDGIDRLIGEYECGYATLCAVCDGPDRVYVYDNDSGVHMATIKDSLNCVDELG